jgi:hypothetical protein
MNIGITGTRYGTTHEQLQEGVLIILREEPDEVHHGDCVGADAEVHHAVGYDQWIVKHPPTDSKYRAFCEGGIELEPKPYLARNRDIVDATELLLAFPDGPERKRSGTWSTVRYAAARNKPVTIIYPDGRIEQRSNT